MNAVLEQEIIQRLHALDEPKLVEVLDFVDFLVQRRRAVPEPSAPGPVEAKPVGGFRPFPAREAQVTNEQVNELRDQEGV
jgi:hypothetical protein